MIVNMPPSTAMQVSDSFAAWHWPRLTFAQKREMVNARRAIREEARMMEAAGYRRHETDWEIHRGNRIGQVIIDAKISADGMYVWTKTGPGL